MMNERQVITLDSAKDMSLGILEFSIASIRGHETHGVYNSFVSDYMETHYRVIFFKSFGYLKNENKHKIITHDFDLWASKAIV
jgi:hypothetical protein